MNRRKEEERRKIKKIQSGDEDTIKEVLAGKFGPICWGCGQDMSDVNHGKSNLQVDHINPKSGGEKKVVMGNAALLCAPCNGKKSNILTLIGLRNRNIKDNVCEESDANKIDLDRAISWSRDFIDTFKGPYMGGVFLQVWDSKGNLVPDKNPPPPWWRSFDPDRKHNPAPQGT